VNLFVLLYNKSLFVDHLMQNLTYQLKLYKMTM